MNLLSEFSTVEHSSESGVEVGLAVGLTQQFYLVANILRTRDHLSKVVAGG